MDLKEANGKKPFNIIVMFDVLEHFENPHEMLNHLMSLTNKEKSYFYIVIPNLNSWHRLGITI